MFWVGTDQHIYYQNTYNGVNWYAPRQAGDGVTNAQVAVASFQNRLYVFIKGAANNRVYYNSSSDGINWSGYTYLNASTNAPLATVTTSGLLYLYLKGQDNNRPYYATTANGSSWTGYTAVPGQANTPTGLGASVRTYNESGLFLVGSDGGIYVNINSSGNFLNTYYGVSGSGQYTDAPVSSVFLTNQGYNQAYYVFSKEYGYAQNPYGGGYLAGYVRWFTGIPSPSYNFANRGFIQASGTGRSGYDGATYTTPTSIVYNNKIFLFITGPNNQYDSPYSSGTIFQTESQ